jgi:uncharacterized protein YdeI (YjbR/CyaY-like superfamily)
MVDRAGGRGQAGGMVLTRAANPMPDDLRTEIGARGLEEAYAARPPYQRNDYLGWIARAKRPDTRRRRIAQMLDELEKGGVYMRMRWNG